ncbi:MAG: hypothetical protein ACI4PH_05275, partial [Faecousia sp.]
MNSSDGKPCSGVRGDQEVSTDQWGKSALLSLKREAAGVFAALICKTKEIIQMKQKHNQTLRLTV